MKKTQLTLQSQDMLQADEVGWNLVPSTFDSNYGTSKGLCKTLSYNLQTLEPMQLPGCGSGSQSSGNGVEMAERRKCMTWDSHFSSLCFSCFVFMGI